MRSRCFGRVRKVLKIKRQSSRGSCPGYCFRKATYYAFEPLLLRGAKYFPGPVLTIKTCRFARLRIFCVSLLTRNGSKNEIISCVPPTSKVIEHATCVVAYRQRRIVNITFWCSENIRSLVDGVETNIIQSRSLKKYKKHYFYTHTHTRAYNVLRIGRVALLHSDIVVAPNSLQSCSSRFEIARIFMPGRRVLTRGVFKGGGLARVLFTVFILFF